MSSSFNYEKALSLDWNGQLFVLTVRNEAPLSTNYLYSYDGTNWTTSSDLSSSSIITSKNPFNIKWTGSNYAMVGNLATGSGNTILRSNDGIKFSPMQTNLSAPIYDLESNLEFPNKITFPRNTTLALGGLASDTTKIAYSTDEGITWTPSVNSAQVFTTSASTAIWNGKTWIAVGRGGNTIATSTDGNTWVGQGSYIFTTAGYSIAWSKDQALVVAGGTGTNSLAYSNDGIFWNGLGMNLLSSVYDIQWNGSIWVAAGVPITGNKSLAYSFDGKRWNSPSQLNLFDISGIKLGWNGSFWTAIGKSTASDGSYNLATSSDGVNWTMQWNQNLLAPIQNMYSTLLTPVTLYSSNGSFPSSPTGLIAANTGTTTIDVSFTPLLATSQPVTSYKADITSGGYVISNQTFAAPAAYYRITGLTQTTVYSIVFYALNDYGISPPSTALVLNTNGIPLAPTNLTVTATTISTISLSFNQSALVNLTSFTVTAVPVLGGTTITQTFSAPATTYTITNIPYTSTGVAYTMSLTVTNSFGTSSSSNSVTASTVAVTTPSAPSALTIGTVTTTSINVTWTPSTDPTLTIYTITAIPSSGDTITETINAPSTSYTLNSLIPTTSYTISLTTTNVAGTSVASNSLIASTNGIPTVPTNLAGTSATISTISISFTESVGNPDTYTVTAVPVSGGSTVTQIFNAPASTYTITGLPYSATNKAYTISLTSTNIYGTTISSSSINYSTIAVSIPSAPTGLIAGTITTTTVDISFNAPTDPTITSYTVTAVPSTGTTVTQTFSAPATSYTITGLTSSKSYTISLQNSNIGGTSVASSSLNLNTKGIPTVPTNLAGTSATISTISISFTEPAIGDPTSYTVTAVPVAGGSTVTQTFSGPATTYTITGFPYGATNLSYTISLTATNSFGTSSSSSSINYSTIAVSIPSAITGLLLGTVTTTTADISFNATTDPTVTSYTVTAVPSTGSTVTETFNTPATSYRVTGLTQSVTYSLTLKNSNIRGSSVDSSSVAFSTLGIPNVPTNLAGTSATISTISISFTEPVLGNPTSYTVTAVPVAGGSTITQTFSGPATTYTITGFPYGATNLSYTISLTATNSYGTSSSSSSINYSTIAVSIPSAPTGLNAYNPGSTTIDLSWNVTSDPTITSYTVTAVPTSGTTVTQTFSAPTTTYTLYGLEYSTSYTISLSNSNIRSSSSTTSITFATVNGPTITLLNYNTSSVNGQYSIFAYTTTGAFSNALSYTNSGSTSIYTVQVAGGGSGGCDQAGGGGGGGVIFSSLSIVGSDTMNFTIGAGGVPTTFQCGVGTKGQDTVISSTYTNLTAIGGGAGSSYNPDNFVSENGSSGGSGGGGKDGYSGTTGQGYNGGSCTYSDPAGYGGGGGAGGVGETPITGAGAGGPGAKISSSLTGFVGSIYSDYYWAGGGGGGYGGIGGEPGSGGNGGVGGGGGGSTDTGAYGVANTTSGAQINVGQNGITGIGERGGNGGANTGGGGGGSSHNCGTLGGNGGSGIILVAVRTTELTIPTPPTGLTGTSATNKSISFSFTPSSVTVDSYTVTAIPTSGSTVTQTFNSPATSYTITGLPHTVGSVSYSITMTSLNPGGVSAPSSSINYTKLATSIASAPSGLAAGTATTTTIPISWTASNDTSITSYSVTAVPTSGTTVTQTFSAPATTYTITGLVTSTTYTISLTAINVAGTSSSTSVSKVTG